MDQIKRQMIVEVGGHRGVTVDDFMSCCTPEETPVVFDGTNSFVGTPTKSLTVIGPEHAQAHFIKCGAGREAECCKFLTASGSGPSCERYGSLRYQLIFKRGMSAQREPVEPYPQCQIF